MLTRSFFLAALALTAPLSASAQDWAIDPSHTSILFEVDHLGFSTVKGTFREFDAEVTFDPDNVAATTVTFTVDAASVDTFWAARDEHVRTADFLDVANHPEITFVSKSVTLDGDTAATVVGDLTIRGITQEITLEGTLNQIGENPFVPGQEIAGFTLTGEIDRTAFGIDLFAPVIGAVLPLTINVELVKQAG